MSQCIYLLVLTVTMATYSHAGNFLLLPYPVTSHCLEMAGIARELLKRNHSVFTYLPDTFSTSNCFGDTKVEIITFKPNEEFRKRQDLIQTSIVELTFAGKPFTHNLTLVSAIFGSGVPLCESALMSTEKLKLLKSKKIDIAIMDSMPSTECLFYIARYLNAETVLEGAAIFPGLGTAVQTHTHPFEFTSLPSSMSLPERVLNTILTVGFALGLRISYMFNKIDKVKLQDYVPQDVLNTDIIEMIRKPLLFMENANDVLDYPKAVYPNFIRVGGLTTRPARQLPADLKDFFSQAKKGVIVVSFGSILLKAPKSFDQRIASIFKHFEQKVIIAYRENKVFGNVKTVSWLPQNEALAHKNTVLFISHCGKNGFSEGFYHGVPMVCTPFQSEQAGNAQKVINHNVGSAVDLMASTDEEVVRVIKQVLNDKSIKANMKRLSAIYHDAKFTPQETAVNALEHVLKYGGAHLRPASSDFNIFSQYMVDIWFIIFTIVCISLYIALKITSCCCRCVCRRRKTTIKKKRE